MEDEIRAKAGNLKNTRIVCRRGSPIDLTDLEIVNPHQSKSIIILSPEEIGNPNVQVIKMILAITNNPQRRAEPYHIVAEILQDEKNMDFAAIVGKDEAKLVLSNDLIARIAVQTCRQTGLSVVYKELLDFDGDEICFEDEPQLFGRSFGETLFTYLTGSLAGIGAPQTLNQGLMHLQIVGLIRIVNEAPGGKHEGHEYEVFLYEETVTGLTPLTPVSGVTNLPHLLPLES